MTSPAVADIRLPYRPAPAPRIELQWRRAVRALGAVLKDSNRSEKVFEVAMSLEGPGMEAAFQKFVHHPNGPELLRRKPSVLEAVRDKDRLGRLPKNTFGYAYYEYMMQDRFDGEGLVQAMEAAIREDDPQAKLDPDRQYFRERNRDSHDLWHALTGYGADQLGEAALLAFTYAQLPNMGVAALIGMAGFLAPLGLPNEKLGFQPYLLQAYRRGRKAAWIPAERIETMLDQPLEEVRRKLRIIPVEKAHPGGIYAYTKGWPKVYRLRPGEKAPHSNIMPQ